MRSLAARLLRVFGQFCKDLVIGDTPELFVGTLAIVGIAFAVRHQSAAPVILPLVAVAILMASAWRGRTT